MENTKRQSEFVLAAATLFVIICCCCQAGYAGRVVAWGWNHDGQCDVPSGDDFIAISANFKHSLALGADGSIVGWGQNNHDQSDPPAGNDFVAIAAGGVHSLALKSDGSLVAWGYNANGECDVPAGSDFVAIAAGQEHNLALRSDRSLVAWGDNDYGQCDVPAGTDFVAIAAGARYSLALRSDGSLVAWGRLEIAPTPWPTYEVPSGNDFAAIAAGSLHNLALKTDGSLVAWGDNRHEQCDVPSGNDFVAVAAGGQHNLALTSDGKVVAWGLNDLDQCDVPSIKDVLAVAAGSRHSVALLEQRTKWDPIADAGDDLVAKANQEVTLDASGSYDFDGEIIEYTWKRLPDGVVIYSEPEPNCQTKALGRVEEVIELTVTDNSMLIASDTMVIANNLVKNLQEQLANNQGGGPNVVYVDAGAVGANDGSCWTDAYVYLQDAIAAATTGCEIRVAQGFYAPDQGVGVTPGDREATFQLIDCVTIKGGYAGCGTAEPDARDINVYQTVLAGDLNGDDGPGFANNSDNSYHVVTGSGTSAGAILDGCTITGGNANGSKPHNLGGGMMIIDGEPTVVCCTVRRNFASFGGGLYCRDECSPAFTNCLFIANMASEHGGAMRNHEGGSPIVTNCTFSANSASTAGGLANYQSSPRLTNSICWANTDDGGAGEAAQIQGGTPVVNYCCIQGWTGALGGTGSIGDDPMFLDLDGPDNVVGTQDDNLRLPGGSPCVDAADNTAVPCDTSDVDADGDTTERVPFDFDGKTRFADDPLTDDTGIADPPTYLDIVDMGVYEFTQ